MKTRDEVEELKRQWLRGPWDYLEDTDGFEEYREELTRYRQRCEGRGEHGLPPRWGHDQDVTAGTVNRGDYPAFPPAYPVELPWLRGLSVREYLTGQALAGLAGNPARRDANYLIAREAVALADAVIVELNRPVKGSN